MYPSVFKFEGSSLSNYHVMCKRFKISSGWIQVHLGISGVEKNRLSFLRSILTCIWTNSTRASKQLAPQDIIKPLLKEPLEECGTLQVSLLTIVRYANVQEILIDLGFSFFYLPLRKWCNNLFCLGFYIRN